MTMTRRVAIVKETRESDRRVILLPAQVREFIDAGFELYVEHDAGAGVGCDDGAYRRAGATIVQTEEAWSCASVVFKCRCPSETEMAYFRPGLHLASTFYLGDKPDLVEELIRKRVSAYSYELFRSEDGTFPLMTTDSEISGHMAVICGAYHLQNQLGGSGVMLGNIPGAARAKVLVIGYGNAGGAAARAAAALGAEVVVVGTNWPKLRKFLATLPPGARGILNSREALVAELPTTDLVIGAILISMFDTPAMIDAQMLRLMKSGSMIIDITCGYGPGYLPTATHRTRDLNDIYIVDGIKHMKNDCMPKLVHLTAAAAGSTNMCAYLMRMAASIYDSSCTDPVSRAGLVVADGMLLHPQVRAELEAKRAASERVNATAGRI
jgi:alanine dehydrogenase